MKDQAGLVQAVGSIYGTLLDDDAESGWLDVLCSTIGAEHAVLSDARGTDLAMHVSQVDDGMKPLARTLAATTIYDPALVAMPARSACRMSDFFPLRELRRTDMYQQLVRPLHGGHALAFTWRQPQGRTAIAVCRDDRRGRDFSDEEVVLLQPLLRHLENAYALRAQLLMQQTALCHAHSALDAMCEGVLIVDSGLCVQYMNPVAKEILGAGDALRLDDRVIRAARDRDERRMGAMVRQALRLGRHDGGRSVEGQDLSLRSGGLPIAIVREPPKRPLIVSVLPASATMRLHCTPLYADAAMLFLRDPDRLLLPDASLLVEAFGLTPREAQLAVALQEGEALSVVARGLGITEGTARQYLKTVFAKMGVQRQSELVALTRALR